MICDMLNTIYSIKTVFVSVLEEEKSFTEEANLSALNCSLIWVKHGSSRWKAVYQ